MNLKLTDSQQALSIPGPAGELEALLEKPSSPEKKIIAIICHPHPLHGGTMNNKVVTTLVRACQALGAIAIRFNFRGVGASEGSYDQAQGEQDDLKAVITWATDKYPDYQLWLAGFSFGSYIAARVATQIKAAQLISIAPPVQNFDFQSLPTLECPWLVVQGEADEVVSAEAVFEWLASRPEEPQLIKMPGVGHFFHGQLIELREAITQALI